MVLQGALGGIETTCLLLFHCAHGSLNALKIALRLRLDSQHVEILCNLLLIKHKH
jgi:hypothetical protein